MSRKLGLVSAFKAGAAIGEYLFVGISEDYTVTHAAASANYPIGVAIGKADSGERIDVQLSGIAEVKVGTGGIAAGKPVIANANGEAVTYVATQGAVNIYAGVALTSGAAGDIIQVKIEG